MEADTRWSHSIRRLCAMGVWVWCGRLLKKISMKAIDRNIDETFPWGGWQEGGRTYTVGAFCLWDYCTAGILFVRNNFNPINMVERLSGAIDVRYRRLVWHASDLCKRSIGWWIHWLGPNIDVQWSLHMNVYDFIRKMPLVDPHCGYWGY